MKKFFCWSLFVFAAFSLLLLINAESNPIKKVALVIGNSAYKTCGLKNPANDAYDLSKKLERFGYEVIKLINAGKQQMKEAIRTFGDKLSQDWNTLGLFYYAGHGCQVKGINYLIPVDADIKEQDEVEYSAIDVGFVLSKMESAGNRVNILMLDACRDNPFRSFRTATRGLTVVEAPKGSLIVYATAPGSVAADGKGRNGVFTGALLKHLDKNPGMDAELFIRNVRKEVMVETGNEQVPWTSSSLTEGISLKGTMPENTVTIVTTTKELEGTLSIWSFTDEFKTEGIIARFEKKHPKVKVNLHVVTLGAYIKDLTSRLRTGKDTPDIFTAENSNLIELTESDFYEDLSREPYNADVSDLFLYLVDAATDSKGALRAVSWQATPGGIYYRRSLARQYLGTDDPVKVGNMLDSEEKFLDVARKINQKSGGKVKILPSYIDYMHYPLCRRTKAFVGRNNKFNLEQCIIDYFDLAKTMYNEHLTAEIQQWSSEWFAEMNKKDAKIFCYILPTWGLHYQLKAHAKNTKGDWGLCKGPDSYFWGGTWIGINKNSKNKEIAWEFIKMLTQDRETIRWYAKTTGDFIGNQAIIEEIKNNFSEPFLKGQNHYLYFADEAPKVKGYIMGKYDLDIWELMKSAIQNYVNGTLTKEEALESFKNEIKQIHPDVIVE
ncbi:MAG: extracellular solute-binding protein [Spirochaetales bacterium]|nr:extracellular solute-binding protein [Spirochaetales bacterium]